ncbi:MAG TPA: hypothetical protein VFF30_17855 [Nitrososphaerales archaeon]|nr:hypothetical protein [Nitrososphaerales archaeon]
MSIDRLARQDTAPPEKGSLMADKEVQSLIQQMLENGVYSIVPSVGEGGLSFPALEVALPSKTEAERRDLLSKLVDAGIFHTKLLDKIIICPTCGSPAIYSKYNCPRCSSVDIGKASIVEHIRCGYIGSKDKFEKGGAMICPNCKSTVGEIDYRKIGTSFVCSSCGSRFEAPKITHKCNSCNDVFTFKEAVYEPIYQYDLSDEAKKTLAKGTLPLASLVTYLKAKGFDVGLKKDIVGKSGATHTFDIVARKSGKLIVANFTFQPKEEDIIGMFAKKYDIDPTHTLLIGLSPPTPEEEEVARAYGVSIISSSAASSLGEQIAELVE